MICRPAGTPASPPHPKPPTTPNPPTPPPPPAAGPGRAARGGAPPARHRGVVAPQPPPADSVGPVQGRVERERLRSGQQQKIKGLEQAAQRLVPGRAHTGRVVH